MKYGVTCSSSRFKDLCSNIRVSRRDKFVQWLPCVWGLDTLLPLMSPAKSSRYRMHGIADEVMVEYYQCLLKRTQSHSPTLADTCALTCSCLSFCLLHPRQVLPHPCATTLNGSWSCSIGQDEPRDCLSSVD
jgi:hypothetical protein